MTSPFRRLTISPKILNSACPWASSLNDLKALYACPNVGAVTTRTATLGGFPDDPALHQVAFASGSITSVNSYGYSPHPLKDYVQWVGNILRDNPDSNKPFIISITAPLTATPAGIVSTESMDAPIGGIDDEPIDDVRSQSNSELYGMIESIQELRGSLSDEQSAAPRIAIEINTSCPNIQGHPPPSYEPHSLRPVIEAVAQAVKGDPTLAVGLKLPPYVYYKQFLDVVDFLASFTKDGKSPIAFLTCTNTLGNSILFTSETVAPSGAKSESGSTFALPSVSGGLAGEALHPIALGNVHTFSTLLKDHLDTALREIPIIGVGGVVSADAAERMLSAGAYAVACATVIGRKGVDVAFQEIVQAPSLSYSR